ncbi:hypothetical protein BDW02DRAFT_565446 [Decorospora gaudefroyi]|uniref:Uncharacterized protein n=1 Tax=Decorospora gaudefroyi TaxID=184978 RepID=A0A6A5KRQ9_9PLEO|nr:hypothetical protein BDW02DRAFT_565446 [Decorospora gaudefroyi]
MSVTYRVYYYCGHLKSTAFMEHSDIESEDITSKRVVIDRQCSRCIYRDLQRDRRPPVIMASPNETAEQDTVYDADDELCARELDSSHEPTEEESGQSGAEEEQWRCFGTDCTCSRCSGVDANPADLWQTSEGSLDEGFGGCRKQRCEYTLRGVENAIVD